MSHLPSDPDSQPSDPSKGINQQANNTSMGGGMQAAQGNENIQIQGNDNLIITALNIITGQQKVTTYSRPRNEYLLLTQVKDEVASRLKKSLHNDVLINLGKEDQPEQVKPPLAADIKIGSKPRQNLSEDITILQVFDREGIAGRLLILGQPGAGKTTTLLELARDLVRRAEQQFEYPLPVLLNLSSWNSPGKSLFNWLVDELKLKYGVRKNVGKLWVEERKLLPLFDGLDEVKPELQNSCVEAINHWLIGENQSLYAVMCCRAEEYDTYSSILEFNGAILLKPLTDSCIRNYLIDINHTKLLQLLHQDQKLFNLSHVPLWLSIIILTYSELSFSDWKKLTPTERHLEFLLDVYIQRMFHRDIKSSSYKNSKKYSSKKSVRWLVWMAQLLEETSRTEFLIEDIQPNLLKSKYQRWTYRIAIGLVSGLILGLALLMLDAPFVGLLSGLFFILLISLLNEIVDGTDESFLGLIFRLIVGVSIGILFASPAGLIFFGLFVGASNGLSIGFSSGIIGGLLFGFIGDIEEDIKLSEGLDWSWQESKYGLILGLICGLLLWIIFNFRIGLISWIISSLLFSTIGGVIGGQYQKKVEVSSVKISNQGIWRSARNSAVWGVSSTFIFGTFFMISFKDLFFGLALGLLFGIFIFLLNGGKTCIQHTTLRFLLFLDGSIPWNYSYFLDYCTERLLLQRVGGRYRFIHKLLQDHFAKMSD